MAINDNTAKWKVRKLTNLQVGSNGYWQPNEEVKVGTIRFPQGNENVGYILECVEAGTTGEEQPTLIGEELANYAEVGRVGQVRVIFNLAEKDVDEVMAMGITYSRLTYPELWDWAGKRAGLIISEEEWQAKFAETNGKFVPYYSSGDGSSTFRTPLLGAYLKGAETSSEVGKYMDAGLPNLYGVFGLQGNAEYTESTGVFERSYVSDNSKNATYTSSNGGSSVRNTFDASTYNSIYGNSDTVTPDTMVGIWVIKAVGVVVDSGETDIAQVLTATEQVQERLSVVEDTKANLGALSMPSGSSISINLEWEGNAAYYTVPTDGWCVWTVTHKNSVRVGLLGTNTQVGTTVVVDANKAYRFSCPFAKGHKAWFFSENNASITNYNAWFFCAQSEV